MTLSESDVFRPPPPRRLFSYDWAAGSVSPFVPSEAAAVEAALRAARVTREDVLLDLGAGDGAVCLCAASKLGCVARGVELDAELVERARRRAAEAGLENGGRVAFERADLFAGGESAEALVAGWEHAGASVITLFLLPAVLKRLAPALKAWLGAPGRGRRVVAFGWPLEALGTPSRAQVVGDGAKTWRVWSNEAA